MPAKIAETEQFVDFSFPFGGLDLTTEYELQKDATTPVATNVRVFEPSTDRGRGGSRPGLSKFIPATVTT